MRLDKYLKEMSVIKRRTVAHALCDNDKVFVNGTLKRASYEVVLGDKISIHYGENEITHEVLKIPYERKKK